ncbi:hypothetical protein [Roseateles sp.]|uniref:hypothetical protein n=1 Tax=Roseateles sp. TaxID=1971397 RepID=UPI003263B773
MAPRPLKADLNLVCLTDRSEGIRSEPWRIIGNLSDYRWEFSAHLDVLTEFVADHAKADYSNEQAFLSAVLHRQGKLKYWDNTWCAGYKDHCIPAWPTGYWRDPLIADGARTLIFHSGMNSPAALAGRNDWNWRHARPARWIADHWRE